MRWAGIAAGISTVVIAGYFVVASYGEQLVFFGEQVTDEQKRRASLLLTMAALVFFVGAPIAVGIARACVRSVERHWPEDAGTAAGLIALCGPVAFLVAFVPISSVSSGSQSFAFGIIWLAGAILVFPLAVTVGMRVSARRTDRYPSEVHPPR